MHAELLYNPKLHAGLYDTSVVYSSGGVTFHLFPHGFKGDKIEINHYFRALNILLKCAQFKGKFGWFKNRTFWCNLAFHCTPMQAPKHTHTGAYTRAQYTSTHYARMCDTYVSTHPAHMHYARAHNMHTPTRMYTHYTYAHYARNPDVLPAI